MRRCAIAFVLLTGCGRIGFSDRGVDIDAPIDEVEADAPTDASIDAGFSPPGGALLWLQMETDPQTEIIDSAGSHAIACTTSCPTPIDGVRGRGYQFAMQQLKVTYTADLDAATSYTAAAWVKLDSYPVGTDACAFNKPLGTAGNDSDTFGLCVQPNGKVYYDSNVSAGGSGNTLLGSTLALGTWHHLAQVWNGTTKIGYFDGAVAAMVTAAIGADTNGLTIGADNINPAYFLTGSVDDAIYYARALSAAEIAQLAAR